MKDVKTKILACLALAASVLFVSATIWEGSASVVPARDLPGETYSIATNHFPRNTVVDVTNLENNRSVRVLVVSGLSNSGLLATLSRGAADSIGMNGDSVRRVRITQPSDSIAFAHIRRGPLPDLTETGATPSPSGAGALADPSAETSDPEAADLVSSALPALLLEEATSYVHVMMEEIIDDDLDDQIAAHPFPVPDNVMPEVTPAVLGPVANLTLTRMHEPLIYIPDFRFTFVSTEPNSAGYISMEYTLVPTEKRLPPAEDHVIPQEYIIPPIERELFAEPVPPIDPVRIVEPTQPMVRPTPREIPFIPPVYAPLQEVVPSDFSPFHAPLVSSLERDMWYVQLGAFAHHNSVEEEISRIAMAYPYPLLIQNIGTDTNPMFRVLLGPLNQGESAAVLRRVRSVGNTQAFVRQAN